jgi:hypothetical protein
LKEALKKFMSDITTASWFPVLTLIIGYGAKSFSEWIEHMRTTKREREARDESRRNQLFERRTSFQRQTLLDLQEACMQLARTTGAMHHLDSMAYRSSGKWHKQLFPSDLDEEHRLTQARTLMLAVRVRDDSVRELVDKLKSLCFETGVSATQEDSDHAITSATHAHKELNQRIGELLRALDDADERTGLG